MNKNDNQLKINNMIEDASQKANARAKQIEASYKEQENSFQISSQNVEKELEDVLNELKSNDESQSKSQIQSVQVKPYTQRPAFQGSYKRQANVKIYDLKSIFEGEDSIIFKSNLQEEIEYGDVTLFPSWFEPRPNRQLSNMMMFSKGLFAMIPPEKQTVETMPEGYTTARYINPSFKIQTGYYSPVQIYRTPFSYGSFRDGNILSYGQSGAHLISLCEILLFQYIVCMDTNNPINESFHRVIWGPIDKVQESNLFGQKLKSQNHVVLYKRPFKESPFDVQITSTALNNFDYFMAIKKDDTVMGNSQVVLEEAIQSILKVYPKFSQLLVEQVMTYTSNPIQAQYLENKRLKYKVIFEDFQNVWTNSFQQFLKAYNDTFLQVPFDMIDCDKIQDEKSQIKFLRMLSQCIQINSSDIDSELRLVVLESVSSGDYLGKAICLDEQKRIHGDMTSGYNGFIQCYVILKSNKVIQLHSQNTFKQPYIANPVGLTNRQKASSILFRFGFDKMTPDMKSLDTYCLDIICPSPEYIFMASQNNSGYYYDKKASVIISILSPKQQHKSSQIQFLKNQALNGLNIFDQIQNQESTIQNWSNFNDYSFYKTNQKVGFRADSFFEQIDKNTLHLRKYILQTKKDKDVPKTFLKTPSCFQKFNWIQFHTYAQRWSDKNKSYRDQINVPQDLLSLEECPEDPIVQINDQISWFEEMNLTSLYSKE